MSDWNKLWRGLRKVRDKLADDWREKQIAKLEKQLFKLTGGIPLTETSSTGTTHERHILHEGEESHEELQ